MARSNSFTTYFNSVVDTTGGAKLDALASQATSAYDRIASAAQRAAQASGLVGGSGSAGLGVSTSLDKQAASARALGVVSAAAGTSTDRFTASTVAAGRASAVAAVENDLLAKSLTSTSTALAVIQGPLGPIAGRIRALSGAFKEFSLSGIGLLGAAAAVAGIAAIGNEYANLETKLRPFFDSQTSTNNALAEVVGIAQSSRAALEPIADLYVRLTTLQKELGAGTNVASLATTIAKASTLSGGSAENQAEGIRQLTQGLGRGILNGQDLRALEEDSFNLAKTIADGLGVNVGQLKQLGAEGKLTTDVVVQALTREAAVVDGQFSKLPVTLSSASREFKNATEVFIGGLDQSAGLTSGLATALQAVAQNIRPIAIGAAAIGAAFAVPKAGGALISYIDDVTARLAAKNTLINQTTAAVDAGTAFEITAEGKAAAIAAQELELAVLRKNAATAAAEDAQANIAFAKLEEDEITAKIALIRENQTAQQQQVVDEIAGLQAVVAERKAALEAYEAEIEQRQTIGATLSRAQPLLQSQAADPTNIPAQEELASQTVQATENQVALSRAQTLAGGAARDLTEAESALAAAYDGVVASTDAVNAGIEQELTLNAQLVEAKITLAATEADAVVAIEAEAAATVQLSVAQEALVAATEAAAAVQAGFLAALGEILALFNPVTIAIGVATAAVIYYATKTSELDTVIAGLNARQKDQIDSIGKVTEAYGNLSVAALKAARDQQQGKVAPASQAYGDARSAFTANLQSAANGLSASDPRLAQLETIIQNYQKGASAQSTYSAFSDLGLGAQSSDKQGILGQAGNALGANYLSSSGTSQVANSFIEVQKAATAATDTVKNLADANTALAAAGKPLPSILSATSKSLAQIKIDAAAGADNGTARANEDAQHRQAISNLDAKFGKGGAAGEDGTPGKSLSGDQAAAAQAAYEAEDKRHNSAIANIASEKTAAHAAAVEAKNDALADVETDRVNSLIDLEKHRGDLTTEQYNTRKEQIDDLADRRKNAIEANGTRAHTAALQELADLTKLNAAFDKQSNATTAFSGKYVDGPKPQAEYEASIAKLRQNENVVDASGKSAFDQTEDAIAKSVSPLNKALNDYYRTLQENGVVGQLAAEGLTAQSDALKEALDLQRTQGDVTDAQVARLVEENQAQEKINETLAARQTITNNILGLVDSTKTALSNFFETLSAGPGKAIGTLATTLETNLKNVVAENLATSLTSGATGAVKTLFQSNAPADVAQRAFAKTIDSTNASFAAEATTYSTSVDKVTSTTERLNTALDNLTTHATAASGSSNGVSGTGLAGLSDSASSVSALLAPPSQLDTTANGNALTKSLLGSQQADGFFPEATGGSDDNAIVVTATKAATAAAKGSAATSPVDALNAIGGSIAGKLDGGLKTLLAPLGSVGDTLDKGLSAVTNTVGKNLGTALQGAGIGATTGSLIFGNNQSGAGKVGDQVGGAIGSVVGKALSGTISEGLNSVVSSGLSSSLSGLAGPLGGVIGSLAGGLLGSLFAKKIQGGATITADSYGNLSSATTSQSNDSKAEAAATSEASTVESGIQQIAQTLGATITGSPNITVGTYKGNYRVNTEGTKLGGSSSPVAGLTDFGDDESAAVSYAIVASIQNGVIKGISQASINILKSGQDLTTALNKALTIENIPKQLEALTNPVKSAVDTLNEQFQTVISDLNEGGATAEQYTEAQELYDKERASAIASAAKSVFGTVEDYITSLTDGTDSVLNKPTTLANSKSTFDALAAQIDAGKTVDQDALVSAAKNYQAASTASNGTNTDFFSDYNYILAELKKADAAATSGVDTSATQTDLPASPFTTDATAAAAIASASSDQVAATNSGTAAIVTGLAAVTAAVQALSSTTTSGPTSSVLGRLTGVQSK